MKKVTVPYTMQDQTLFMQPLLWPDRCLCCGKDQAEANHKFEFKANYQSNTVGSTTTSKFYPLEWQVPICPVCKKHVSGAENLLMIVIVVGLVLTIAIPFIFGFSSDSMRVMAVLVGVVLAGIITYQLIMRLFIKRRMHPECTHLQSPIFGYDSEGCIDFYFYNDSIADEFALLNGYESITAEKPSSRQKKK